MNERMHEFGVVITSIEFLVNTFMGKDGRDRY